MLKLLQHLWPSNQAAYDSRDVVAYYTFQHDLQPPERTILARLQPHLHRMRVFDVGVGAGRTTAHLADAAVDYLAIDSSPRMIEACRRRFPHLRHQFRVEDVRRLEHLDPRQFDLILFSYNGLDYISHRERLAVLSRLRVLSKPGGWFVFSSHNLRSIDRMSADLEIFTDIAALARRAFFYLRLRLLNDDLKDLRNQPHGVIQDFLRIRTYYIDPEAQLAQLRDCGFRDIDVLGLDGEPIAHRSLRTASDPWLYYVCRV
jgi:SAM-dependent methyltransferase